MAKAGRKPLPPGERKVRQHLNLSSDVVEWLDQKNNKSAYVEALIKEDMMQQPIRTTIGTIAEMWGSEPSEWGLHGTIAHIEAPGTVAEFRRDTCGGWQLWVQYPDNAWDSPSEERWGDEDVQGLR